MRKYVVVEVPYDLLPQVANELLQFATDPNLVEVVHGPTGRVIHAHPEVADAWYQSRKKVEEEAPEAAPAVEKQQPEPPPLPNKLPADLAEAAKQKALARQTAPVEPQVSPSPAKTETPVTRARRTTTTDDSSSLAPSAKPASTSNKTTSA